ncbi:MAG: DNA-directed RNA polymerase subunit beta [Chloroflexi bacterium]|nr:DNA-directed RNA polymerase subunit beta [Chloroflexota bacterium]
MVLAERPTQSSLALKDSNSLRQSFARIREVAEIPDLIQVQRDSFEWFLREGLKELFAEISPIQDFTTRNMDLELAVPGPNGECGYWFGTENDPEGACADFAIAALRRKAKMSEEECREKDSTFGVPLKVRMRLRIKSGENSGEIKEQAIFMGDFPLMTSNGTFIINGAERVVVSQLVRSPGAYFTTEEDPASGRELCMGKLIPSRGAWLEFETSTRDVMSVKVDRKRKIPITTLLRALPGVMEKGVVIPGLEKGTNEEMLALFADDDRGTDHHFVQSTLDKDPAATVEEALLEFYRRLRPGDPPNLDNARSLLKSLFFNFRRYDLGKVGRYKVNKRLELNGKVAITERILTPSDIIEIVRTMVKLNHGKGQPDDIDHLGNRRVRAVGELIQNQFRVGLLRMERVVKERMSITDPATATPSSLTNIRPVVAAMREFFGGSQLSQFMDQTNPLAELTHKRRLSALGPGGLSRDRAGFEVRDVHHSHYGRICPIETPEGPNIGLIGSLATYGRINEYGFIETPYRAVVRTVANAPEALVGLALRGDLKAEDGKKLAAAGTTVDAKLAQKIADSVTARWIDVIPHVTAEIRHLTADEEDRYTVAQANVRLRDDGTFLDQLVSARHGERFLTAAPEQLDFVDVSPKQTMSVAGALIPFLEHDDANRALMGCNMQRQAVPLLQPNSPLVGTGMELKTARDSGQVIMSSVDGVVESVSATEVAVRDEQGSLHRSYLRKFVRTNQGTCFTQRPIVMRGQRVSAGDPLADSSSTQIGELALGQNVLVSFISWEGGNFEDAILLSEQLVWDDKFTSIHIEKHEVEARDTKLGPEEITRDIPNVGEDSLRDLDELGIIRVGAEVKAGDILVGKITPKGETELTAEERLLRAIFGEKAREVKDTSLRVPHGERGKVVNVQVFDRELGETELSAGVNKMVRVSIAQKRKISAGDKMAGRHGNKGVVSRILPLEDMPFLPDGQPVEIILNPLGVPSRMNVGQILETHLGWAADALGVKYATPVFDGASESDIKAKLREAGLPENGKIRLRDGRTGELFDQEVTVGYIYMLKLVHLVEDKIHARSTGPYSLITQQPLGGKAQFGGQRFGEMEVWALEAYGAAHTLQEILTVKSDDVVGRVKTYEAIVKGEDIFHPGVPESFKVLVKELQSLGLAVEVLNEEEEEVEFADDLEGGMDMRSLDINISGFERGEID